MKNGFKNNPLASGLLGVIIGAGGVLGVQTLATDSPSPPLETSIEHPSAFELVLEDANGPYVVTLNGGKFHDPGCSHLSSSPASNIKHVNETDAKAAGYGPCSTCLKH